MICQKYIAEVMKPEARIETPVQNCLRLRYLKLFFMPEIASFFYFLRYLFLWANLYRQPDTKDVKATRGSAGSRE